MQVKKKLNASLKALWISLAYSLESCLKSVFQEKHRLLCKHWVANIKCLATLRGEAFGHPAMHDVRDNNYLKWNLKD